MTHRRSIIEGRLARETGTLRREGARAVAMVYPSPYPVGMSSLGYQTLYRRLNELPNTVAERSFLPDDAADNDPLITYESQRPVGNFPVIALSVAYELELSGVFRCLELSGVAPERRERTPRDPFVIMGGPLTFSNPVPLAPFADVIVMGEAEGLLERLLDRIFAGGERAEVLREVRDWEGLYVPEYHHDWMPPVAKAPDHELPAYSAIITPDAALSNMFLIECERGCSRACSFCVMRRSTNGGMRLADPDRIQALIPKEATRVGLVGAAVSDHPRVVNIVRAIVESGREIGLSSLRADRLTEEFVQLLQRGGYRTLTVASDGASEELRKGLLKKIRAKHLRRAAELAGQAGMRALKVYMMVGVPDETDADLDELIAFTREQAELAGKQTKVVVGIAPFVAKRNTPLDGAPFVGIREADRRLEKLRKGLMPAVEVRSTSSRWAWAEYMLAQGGPEHGLAALQAYRQGGRFAHYKRAFKNLAPRLAPAPRAAVAASPALLPLAGS